MQAFFGGRHEAIEQGRIHAVKILQGVEDAELRPQIEMERGVADGGEVDEYDIAMRLLQGERGIDGGGGGSGAAFGAEEGEDSGFVAAAGGAGARGAVARECFEQSVRSGRAVE